MPSTTNFLEYEYESQREQQQDELLNGDYKSLSHSNSIKQQQPVQRPKGLSASINIAHAHHQWPAASQEFELTSRRGHSFKTRVRTNSTKETAVYSPKRKPQHTTSHDTIASSLKRMISANGKEKLSPTQVCEHKLSLQSSEFVYRFKANRSLSNNSYARDIDEDDDDDNEEISDEEATDKNVASSAKLLRNNRRCISENERVAPLDEAEKTSLEYSTLDSTSSSSSSSSAAPPLLVNLDQNNNLEEPRVVIENGKVSHVVNALANKSPSMKVGKRTDSIRMRHNSSQNLNGVYNGVVHRNSSNDVNSGSKREKLRRALKRFNRNGGSQKRQNFIIVVVLCVVNLLNYIDRFTLAGSTLWLFIYLSFLSFRITSWLGFLKIGVFFLVELL